MSATGTGEAVTEDRLLGGRVVLRQPAGGYRAAIDPVLLAASVDPACGTEVADLGCGAGAATLCLARRLVACRVTGIERDPAMAALARDNLRLNGLADRCDVVTADLATPPPLGPFEQAIANPPFLPDGAGTASPRPRRRAAGMEAGLDLAGWTAAAARLLGRGGRLTMIHRADRLDALCAALLPTFGEVVICPLWPRRGAAARRVLVRARRGARSPARLLPGLVLHEAGGGFTPEAEAILRHGAPLPL